jgi:hypothetical protein
MHSAAFLLRKSRRDAPICAESTISSAPFMNQPIPPLLTSQLTNIEGLRFCGIFPQGKEPSIRTLRNWTKLRRIPSHKVGHFIYYDPAEVAQHIRTKLRIPARGETVR